jgi:hypothetical protein
MGTNQDDEQKKQEAGETAKAVDPMEKLAKKRRRQRTVIISALAAGGVFQLNGWQVQAHGNRSTLSASPIQRISILPGSFRILPSSFTALAQQLGQVSEQLRTLEKTNPGMIGSTDHKRLTDIQASLAKKLDLRPESNQSYQMARSGDVKGAVAAIEGEGQSDRAVSEYQWTLLDIAHGGRGRDTMAQFTAMAKPAMAYSAKVLGTLQASDTSPKSRELKQKIAQIYHQVASYTVPNDGVAAADDQKLGREAADRALKIQQEMGKPRDIMVAEWMSGNHAQRAGDSKAAELHLRHAAELAVALDDKAAVAWSYSYLSRAVATSNPAEARALEHKAVAAADADKSAGDATLEFLRIQMRLAMK